MEVLERKKIIVSETVDARKTKIEADEAWALLSSGKKILIAKGKKLIEMDAAQADRYEVLQIALGRSGTLRAPTLKVGDTWLVGFNDEAYDTVL